MGLNNRQKHVSALKASMTFLYKGGYEYHDPK